MESGGKGKAGLDSRLSIAVESSNDEGIAREGRSY